MHKHEGPAFFIPHQIKHRQMSLCLFSRRQSVGERFG
jgi:hypothetical protein